MKLPAQFGKYCLLEKLAVGGMAEVYLAKSFGAAGFERLLVIKKILPHMAEDREFITMFIDEARIASTLNHSNIVQITELGREGQDYFIAMEFVLGKDLSRIIDRLNSEKQRLPIPLAVLITSQVCEGLDYAHRKTDSSGRSLHIIHRDVSPGNVLVSYDGEVKLIDFGIAKAQNRMGRTTAGTLKGKFGYMSPEQVRGLPLDHRSDIFSVGILLYEMLTGERLFASESDFGTLEKVRNAQIAPPTTYNTKIPGELEKVVMRALAREPEERFDSASELQEALTPFLLEDGTLTTAKSLAAFMRKAFSAEIAAENERLAVYRRRGYPWMDQAMAQEAQPDITPGDDLDATAAEPLRPEPPESATFIMTPDSDDYTPPPEPEQPKSSVEVAEDQATVVVPGVFDSQQEPAARARPSRPDPAPRRVAEIRSRPPALRARTGTEPLRGRPLPVRRPASSRSTWLSFLAGLVLAGVLAAGYLLFLAPENREPRTPGIEKAEQARAVSEAVARPPAPAPPTPAAAAAEATPAPKVAVQPRPKPEATPASKAAAQPRPKPEATPASKVAVQPRPKPEATPAPKVAAQPRPKPEATPAPKVAAQPRPWPEAASRPVNDRPARRIARGGTFSLRVTSTPAGATILLNGKPSGVTPRVFAGLDAKRNYFLVLKKDGYKPFFHSVKHKGRTQVEVAARLQAKAVPAPAAVGYLVANTRPWARVFVDGKDTGLWTPIPPHKKLQLPAGNHRLTFRTQDGRELQLQITIEPGRTLKVIKKIP